MDESPSKREGQWRLTKAFLPAFVFFGLGALIGVGAVRKAEAEGNSIFELLGFLSIIGGAGMAFLVGRIWRQLRRDGRVK